MKATVFETDYAFGVDLIAENLADAAWMTRFQRNIKHKFPDVGAQADRKSVFRQWVSFQRKREDTSIIGTK